MSHPQEKATPHFGVDGVSAHVAELIVFLILGSVVLGVAWTAASNQKAAAAALAERSRGLRVTELLERLEREPNSDRIAAEVLRCLESPPVGFFPELVATNGWFARSHPALARLWQSRFCEVIVQYFRWFTFPAGQQGIVLSWLSDMLDTYEADPVALRLFRRVGASVLAAGGPAEAQWLYARTLDVVQRTAGTEIKIVALTFGRTSYALHRPAQQSTVYDEQAIANDINVRRSC
jgi:hypothetical protein